MKRSLFVFLLAVLVLGAWAQAISEQDAKARVLQYLQNSERAKARGGKPIGEQLTLAKVGAEKIYAYNLEGGGYVIASGDIVYAISLIAVLLCKDKANKLIYQIFCRLFSCYQLYLTLPLNRAATTIGY